MQLKKGKEGRKEEERMEGGWKGGREEGETGGRTGRCVPSTLLHQSWVGAACGSDLNPPCSGPPQPPPHPPPSGVGLLPPGAHRLHARAGSTWSLSFPFFQPFESHPFLSSTCIHHSLKSRPEIACDQADLGFVILRHVVVCLTLDCWQSLHLKGPLYKLHTV